MPRSKFLSLSDFPGRKQDDTKEYSISTKEVSFSIESAPIPDKLRDILAGDPEGQMRVIVQRDFTRDALIKKRPRRYAITSVEIAEAETALKRLDYRSVRQLLAKHKERIATRGSYDGPWYKPERGELDLFGRARLARKVISEFRLLEINPAQKPISLFRPMPPSRYEAFIRLNSDSRFDSLNLSSATDMEYALVSLGYIIRRYAVGELIYTLNSLDQRMVKISHELTVQQNACKLKFVLNYLMLPFLCTLLSVEDSTLAQVMDHAVRQVEELLTLMEDISAERCDLVHKALIRTWNPEDTLTFGMVLQFYLDCDARELSTGSTHSISQYFTDMYGSNGEMIVSSLQKGKLHRCCLDLANEIDNQLGMGFVRDYYEKIGFTVSAANNPFDIRRKSLLQFGVPIRFADDERLLSDYLDFRKSCGDAWERESAALNGHVKQLCADVLQKKYLSRKSVTAEFAALAKEYKWPSAKRVLLARRALLAIYRIGSTKWNWTASKTLSYLGYRTTVSEERQQKDNLPAMDSHPRYLTGIGLTPSIVRRPTSEDLFPEEIQMLESCGRWNLSSRETKQK